MLVGHVEPGVMPLAPGARLLVAETVAQFGDAMRADAASVLRGINWALSNGARVIAMSIEGSANRVLAFGLRAAARETILVAAAGNGGPKASPAYPAAYPEVIAVAAVDTDLRPYRMGTRGDFVELTAPGVGIVSAGPEGSTRSWSGSSFAVPYVAAAFLRANAATRSQRAAARKLLVAGAQDLGAPGRDEVYGYGLVQNPWPECL
jgi:subtilisin family serine protease